MAQVQVQPYLDLADWRRGVYDARSACSLAPRENWLTVPVRAGEKLFP